MISVFKRFYSNESGATAFEYALLAGLIGVTIAGTVGTIGSKLNNAFTNISNKITS